MRNLGNYQIEDSTFGKDTEMPNEALEIATSNAAVLITFAEDPFGV